MEHPEVPQFLGELVDPWYASLWHPAESQQRTLQTLLEGYAKTAYGERYGARSGGTIGEFQSSFPIVNYADLKPSFDEVRNGNYSAILPEPAVGWVMTRGTTGTPKVIPTTQTHLTQILLAGARAIVSFAIKKGLQVLEKNVLNLNFPSIVNSLETPSGTVRYGYSSGTYAKLNPSLGGASLVPHQEEIDSLGSGVIPRDWEARFQLVYEKAKDSGVGSIMGVTPVLLAFANYLKRKHHTLPKLLWKMEGLFCTSVPKIHTKYAPVLRHVYGNAPVVEMYTATEGVFAQQLDDLPYVCPNYDVYLFEVKTSKGVKMLHELKRHEWGRIVISSCLFPRYDIGDFVESVGKGYFRIFGRAGRLVSLEHVFFNALAGRF